MKISFIQGLSKQIAIFLMVLIIGIPFSYAIIDVELEDIIRPVGPETFEEFAFEGEWEDIIINVLEKEPVVLRAAVVQEINAPIYVSLYGIPTAGRAVPRIKHISIRETDTNWLSGVTYHPPEYYSWDNLGYFDTKLRRISNFDDIPDSIDIDLIAKIRYEAETTADFIGAVQTKKLEEKPKISKDELLYRAEYNIFNKGYIVANKVGKGEAEFTIYDSEGRRIRSFSLDIDQESGTFGLVRGSRENEDFVRVRLDSIIDGSQNHVVLYIPSYRKGEFDEKAVGVGGDMGNGWKVTGFEGDVVSVEKGDTKSFLFKIGGEGNFEDVYKNLLEEKGLDSEELVKELKRDFGGIVRVKEVKRREEIEAVFDVGTREVKANKNDAVGSCVLTKIEPGKVTLVGKKTYTLELQTSEEREREDKMYLKAADNEAERCGKSVLLKEIHTYNIAQVTILTGRKVGETETSFSLHIPIDKGPIHFSDEDLENHIEGTQKIVEGLDKVIKNMEEIIKVWRIACKSVGAILVIGKYLSPVSKVTGGVISEITGAVAQTVNPAGLSPLVSADDVKRQLYFKRDATNLVYYKETPNLLYDSKGNLVNQNIVYDDEKPPQSYYYKPDLKGYIPYNGLNDDEYKRIYTDRKEGKSIIVVPIGNPDALPSGGLKDYYLARKDKYALDKGFYVVYYEKDNILEIYHGTGEIDLGYVDDRVVGTLKDGAAYDDFKGNFLKKINVAQQRSENEVKVGDNIYLISSKKFEPDPLTCAKVLCPPGIKMCWQCRLLFNVCDPVECPSSRCNLGGEFPTKKGNIIGSGLIASLLLCTPNFKWENGGVAVPFCITGIYASLAGIRSMFDQYKNCLIEQKAGNKNFGLCERIQSITLCNIFWEEIAVWLILKGKWIGSLLGLFTGGGGEYWLAPSDKRVSESRKVVNYFVQDYAQEVAVKFKGRSTKDIGAEICKNFVGGKLPAIGEFFDQFVTPEKPPQAMAHFEERPYSVIAGTSEYTVFYQIYAGTLKTKPKLDYYVYLRKQGERDLRIARGTLTKEEAASDTVIRIAVPGYEQICVNLDNVPNCIVGKLVSTDWALNQLTESIVKRQIGKEITKKEQCKSSSSAFLGVAGVPVERRCDLSNPGLGLGTLEESKWRVAGDCGFDEKGVYLGKCWMKVESEKMRQLAEEMAKK